MRPHQDNALLMAIHMVFLSCVIGMGCMVPCMAQQGLHEEWSVSGVVSRSTPYSVAGNGTRLVAGFDFKDTYIAPMAMIYDVITGTSVRTIACSSWYPYPPQYWVLTNDTEMMLLGDQKLRFIDLATGADTDSVDAVVSIVYGVTQDSRTIVFYGQLTADAVPALYLYDRTTHSIFVVPGTESRSQYPHELYQVQMFPASNNIFIYNVYESRGYVVHMDGRPVYTVIVDPERRYYTAIQSVHLAGPEHIVSYDAGGWVICRLRDGERSTALRTTLPVTSGTASKIAYLGTHFVVRNGSSVIVADRDLNPRCTVSIGTGTTRWLAAYQQDSSFITIVTDCRTAPDTSYTIDIADGTVTARALREDVPQHDADQPPVTKRLLVYSSKDNPGPAAMGAFYDIVTDSTYMSFRFPLAYLEPMHAHGDSAQFCYTLPNGKQGVAEVRTKGTTRLTNTPWTFPGNAIHSYRRTTRDWVGVDSAKGYVHYGTFDTVAMPLPIVVGRTTICTAGDGASYFIVNGYGQVQHIDTTGELITAGNRTLPMDASMYGYPICAQHIDGDTIALVRVEASAIRLYFISATGLDSGRTITMPPFSTYAENVVYVYDTRTRCHAIARHYAEGSDTVLYLVREHQPLLVVQSLGFTDLCFHPTADILVGIHSYSGIALIDTRTGHARTVESDMGIIRPPFESVRWAPEGERLIIRQSDGIVRYDIETGTTRMLVPFARTDRGNLMNDGHRFYRIVESPTERRYHITDLYTGAILDSTSYRQLITGLPTNGLITAFSNGMFISSIDTVIGMSSMHIQEVVTPHRYQRYFDLPDPIAGTAAIHVSSRHAATVSVVDLRQRTSYILDGSSYRQLAAFPDADITEAPLHLGIACEHPDYEIKAYPLDNLLGHDDAYGNTTHYAHASNRTWGSHYISRPILEKSGRIVSTLPTFHLGISDVTTAEVQDTLPVWSRFKQCSISPDERFIALADGEHKYLDIYDLSNATLRSRHYFPNGAQRVEWPDDPSTILVWHDQFSLSAYSIDTAMSVRLSSQDMIKHPWTASHHDGMLTVRLVEPADATVDVHVYALSGELLASGGFVGSAAEGILPVVCANQPLLVMVRNGEHITTGMVLANTR